MSIKYMSVTIRVYLYTVPSQVTGLQVENLHSTCSLQVSWQEALGIADRYNLQVLDNRGSLVTNCSQPTGQTSYRFDGLIPGKKYRVLVQTISGGVHSLGVSAEARTRKTFIQQCQDINKHRGDEQGVL